MAIERIPVYLLTGFLGSGKTTLLSRWLQHPELRDAAVIVNEIGEVGFDDKVLASATDSAALIANACVCCTGLPGLEEALEDLFWARLQRRMPAFGSVVIETTGLADPAPVVESLANVALLSERYRLAGVITTVGAVAGATVLARHEEARSQARYADVLIVTKTDIAGVADVRDLAADLRAVNARAPIETSGLTSLGWDTISRQFRSDVDICISLKNDHAHNIGTPISGSSEVHARETTMSKDHASEFNGHEHLHDKNEHAHHDSLAHEGLAHDDLAHHGDHTHAHEDHGHHAHAHDAITSFVVMSDAPSRQNLQGRLQKLAAELGDTLLRLKGWVALDDGTLVSVQMAPAESRIEIRVAEARVSNDQGRRSGVTIITRGSQVHAALILNSDW